MRKSQCSWNSVLRERTSQPSKHFFFLSMVQWWHWISKFPFDGQLLASLWVGIHSFLCVCELASPYNSNETTTCVRLFQMWFHCLKINRLSWMPSRLYITKGYVMCSHQFLWLGITWITETLYDNFFFFFSILYEEDLLLQYYPWISSAKIKWQFFLILLLLRGRVYIPLYSSNSFLFYFTATRRRY